MREKRNMFRHQRKEMKQWEFCTLESRVCRDESVDVMVVSFPGLWLTWVAWMRVQESKEEGEEERRRRSRERRISKNSGKRKGLWMRTLYRQRMLKGVITDGRNRQDCLFWRSIHSWHLEGKTGKWKECSTKMSQQQEKELFPRRRRRRKKSSEDIICFFVLKKNRKSFSLGKVKRKSKERQCRRWSRWWWWREGRQISLFLLFFVCFSSLREEKTLKSIWRNCYCMPFHSLVLRGTQMTLSLSFLSIFL